MLRQSWRQLFYLIVGLVCLCEAQSKTSPLRIEAVNIGPDTKLTCSNGKDSNEKDIIDMHWEKPEGTIIGYGPELILKNVQDKDLGEYICRLTENIDSQLVSYKVVDQIEQRIINIEQIQSPNIIIFPPVENDMITLQETQNLNIGCKAGNWSSHDYSVQWIKSDGYVVSDNSQLFIESILKKQHQGTYTCAITHKKQKNQVFNKKITVTITRPSVSILIMAGEKLQINGLIHRKCVGFNLHQSTETFSYVWLDSQGRTISRTATIQVPINDDTIFGSYECHYIARKSGETFVSKVEILAQEKFESQTETYLITMTPYPQKFRLNEKFSIRCQVVPTLKNIVYTWYKNDELLTFKQETLVFDSFTRADLGVYKCKVQGMNEQNVLIELEAKSYQRLSVFVPIKVELIEGAGSQVAVVLSNKKELHCEISPDSSYSGSDVEWSFENQKLSTHDSLNKYNIARVNGRLVSILILSNTQIINEGHYQCRTGGVTKTVNIVVIKDDGLLVISPLIEKTFEGQPAEFHCRINNIPNIKNTDIKWFFVKKGGSQRVALPNNRWTIMTQHAADKTSFISTDSTEMKDNGYFICTAPTGQESQAELIVEERQRPFIAKISPQIINIKKRQRFEFECFTQDKVGNPIGEPQIRFLNGTLVSEDKRFTISKVGPSRVRVVAPLGVDAKEMKMTCGVRETVATITINVRDICPPYHRYCKSGECIANNKFCDGTVDCADGSDEDISYCNTCDPISKPCSSITANNTKIQYYNINWACDGEYDCPNGFDEKHCDATSKCYKQQFTCEDGHKIPRGYVCDKSPDCKNGEDEIGCVPPQIIKTSSREIRARSGTTVKLSCEIVGHPLPKVTWRFNWNCLPDENRMVIKEISNNCRKVISVLTLKNFQAGDDAIYNCEAIGGESRVLSEPFQVTLED